MPTEDRRTRLPLRLKAISLAVASCFSVYAHTAHANPNGFSVVNGQATFNYNGQTLTISNTPGSIINWQSFSIGAGELTRFLQQSGASSVLNRVTGVDPSLILGALQSNGRVFLINPNGILFGAGSQIDVAGLVASTLNLSNADFLAGRLRFTDVAGAGGITNQGSITTPGGGQVYLIAPNVANSGIITSPQGEIILAAGRSVELVDAGTPGLRVELTAPDNEVVNVGQVIANSGRVGIYAGLIRNSGTIRADGVVTGQNGEILLKAHRDITLEPGSLVSASGTPSGVHDGGKVRIVAEHTLDMQAGSTVRVDGGIDGGNGGFLELSGYRGMRLDGVYSGRALAQGYRGGKLLLDPANIDITTAGCGVDACLNPDTDFVGFADYVVDATANLRVLSAIGNEDVNGGAAGGSLTLNAGNDLSVFAPIGSAGTRFDHDLSLNAGNHVVVNNSIYLGNRTLTLAADATIPSVGAVGDGIGDVKVFATSVPVVVDTLGSIAVSGVSFQVGSASATRTTTVNAGLDLTATVSDSVKVLGGHADGGEGSNVNATAILSAGRDLTITAGNGIEVRGGDATADISGSSGSVTARADAKISAGRNLTFAAGAAGVLVRGGSVDAEADGGEGGAFATASADALVSAVGHLKISAGSLTVSGGDNARARAAGSSAVAVASASANATVSGNTVELVLGAGGLTVRGGDDAQADVRSGSSGQVSTLNANGQISAASSLTLTVNSGGSILVRGGNNPSASASEGLSTTTVTTNVNGAVSAGGSMQITMTGGGSLEVMGGDRAYAYASASSAAANITATANAKGTVAAGGSMQISMTGGGSLEVRGGDHAQASASASSAGANVTTTASAKGTIAAGGALSIVTDGSIMVRGGQTDSSSAARATGFGTAKASEAADAAISAGGSVSVTAQSIFVGGGWNSYAEATGGGSNEALRTANGSLTAGGSMSLTVANGISIDGGEGASAYANANTFLGGNNAAAVSAGASIGAAGSLTISAPSGLFIHGGSDGCFEGGCGAVAGGAGTAAATVLVDASLLAGGDFTYTGGDVQVSAGTARAEASAGGAAAAFRADAGIGVAGAKTMNITGDLRIRGGFADGGEGGAALALASASATLDPAGASITTSGDIYIEAGGVTPVNSVATASLAAAGPIVLNIGGSTGLTISGVQGGASGTGIFANAASPVTVTFTGGGTQTIDDLGPGHSAAFIRTFDPGPVVIPPVEVPATPEPPPSPPPSITEPVKATINSIVDAINQSTKNPVEKSAETETEAAGDKDKQKKQLPICS